MLSVPFALVGGAWLMWWLGYNLSVAVAVGFIALADVAAETGVVMLIYLDHALKERAARCHEEGRAMTREDLRAAIMAGAVERVRPKMMTVVAIMAGLLPILWSKGAGSEVMRRIAVPMVGCMLSSTFLTLIVIPAIYVVVKRRMVHATEDAPVRPLTRQLSDDAGNDARRNDVGRSRPAPVQQRTFAVGQGGAARSTARAAARARSRTKWTPMIESSP